MVYANPSTTTQRFLIHKVISKSLRIFSRRPFVYTLSALIPLLIASGLLEVALIVLGLDLKALTQSPDPMGVDRMTNGFYALVLGAGALGFCSAASLQIARQDIRGERLQIGKIFRKAARTCLPLAILSMIATAASLAGLMMFVIGGLIFISMWALAAPVCAFESLGPMRSLGRSNRLTGTSKLRFLGLTALFLATNAAVYIVGQALESYASGNGIPAYAHMTAQLVLLAALLSYSCVFVAVAYYDLLATPEGRDVDGVATVFE